MILLDCERLEVGGTALARIEPLFPERWAKLRVGEVIHASYFRPFAEASILAVVDDASDSAWADH